MKRSEINKTIRKMEKLIAENHFALPPFTDWTPESWQKKGQECREIKDNMLGWDVTDYGEGHFDTLGLALITIRNGNAGNPRYAKSYAEKLIMSDENQISPMHFHFKKMEDIINRGGGNMQMRLYNSNEDGSFADTDVKVQSDGVWYTVPAGSVLTFEPGQSITLSPGLYHEFWAEEGKGPVLIGEVSETNDDNTDNRFYEPLARFAEIEEDEAPYRLLCNEYPEL
ncbi:MAG: D-lyxose/D-mannose family sugar isomerase [Clostridiales Family XIII bacterium]|jgi:D-lyxose ketol-isomerase|nr:D-lyxose/D-mannose family sugar isomerase [Clostridiales Family XIII bacterium]